MNYPQLPVGMFITITLFFSTQQHRTNVYKCFFRHSIGYMSFSEALLTTWTIAEIENKYGNITSPFDNPIDEVMRESLDILSSGRTTFLVDSDVPDSYPMLGYSYIIIRHTTMHDCYAAVELYRYIEWLMYDAFAEEMAQELGMSQILPELAHMIDTTVLHTMLCRVHNVRDLVIAQMLLEEESSQLPWRMAAGIFSICFGFIILLMVAYIIYQQLKLRY